MKIYETKPKPTYQTACSDDFGMGGLIGASASAADAQE